MKIVRTIARILAILALMASGSALAQKPIKIGFSMALTGGLAGAGKAALIAMEIWRDDTNKNGGLLGRPVEFVYYDDATQPAKVPAIYTKLLEVDKVDLVVSSYGTNEIAPAMPIVMRKKLVFPSLFGLAVNDEFKYNRYFQIMPSGPEPKTDWSKGFFELAMAQNPKPKTIAIVSADAEFSLNAAGGARKNAQRLGMKIVYDKTYPPSTTDFTPIVRAIQATNPDIVYVGSYPPDSVGMVKAANEVGLAAKMFGGSMVGLQFAAIQKNLGPMLNGIINYDFWVPEPTLDFPGVKEFLAKYQDAAKGKGVDPLGHYLPPYAYAYLQVLGQSVQAVKSLDQAKLAAHMHKTTFDTVVGKVKFGSNGEWAKSRVLFVQFRDVQPNNLEQFAGPGKRIVLHPKEWKSGEIVYPYKK
ncbi:MAG: branched-chain amino acid ABC transporter substrate-binding protein [Betaproteobacteria bacterium SG8_41]|jgi:branched-chain amino acid transport system substrate-binding protein|nr:MAG: branched-chain amino acid ABC transporter substrate-binding protein [Betaproteobacteria bacterium SG8_41]